MIELITQWTSGWTAIPAFYVDTPLVTATEVFDVGQCEVAARRWLKAARGAGATTVLFDAPDRVNPRKLVHGSDSPDGVLTPDQIEALRDYSEVLGVKILWSGGITAPQAFDLARRRVFGIFSTSSTAAKIAVTAQFQQDPRLAAENEPTEFGVRRMHAIIQGGFLSSRMRELDEGLARELETFTTNLVASGGEAAKSQAALETLNELLVRGWRHLIGAADDTKSQVANRNRRAPRPVPADSVRVFRGRKKAGVRRDIFVERLGQLFMPFTVQMQRQYGLTAYLPAVLPESRKARFRTRSPWSSTARRSATTKRNGASAAEHTANYTSWFSICRPAEAGSLNCSRQTRSRPTSPITSSSDPLIGRPAIAACS